MPVTKLLSILLISSICLTQEMEVDGDLKVTGTVESTTIDSLKAVIAELQAQLAALQGNSSLRIYEFDISIPNQNEAVHFNLNELTGYDLNWYKFEILFFSEGSGDAHAMWVSPLEESELSRGEYFVNYNNGSVGWDFQNYLNSKLPVMIIDDNPIVKFTSSGGDLSFHCTVLLTAQFPN